MPIATGMLLASTLAQAGLSAGMSFGQAAKQNKLRKKAEVEAGKKIDAARSRLEKNFMESLSIPMKAYEAQNEAILVAGSQAMDAAREGSQRGVGTVAQNVLNFEQDKLRETSIRQEQQLFNLDAATAEEESRLRDARAGIDLQEAEGAQMVAADATAARNAAIQQGIGAVTEGIGAGLQAGSLYKADKKLQGDVLQGIYQDGTGPKGMLNPNEFKRVYGKRKYNQYIKNNNFLSSPEFLKRYGNNNIGNTGSYYNFGLGGTISGSGIGNPLMSNYTPPSYMNQNN